MHLCDTCREGHVVIRNNGTKITWCNTRADTVRLPNDVVKCSDYNDKRFISQWELEKIAWTLQTNKSGQAIGFAPPDKNKG